MNKSWNFVNSYTQLPEIFYQNSLPEGSPAPKLVILNEPLARTLGLDPQYLQSPEGIHILAGNLKDESALESVHPIAQAYGGHQYGHFRMLGDGRAVLLGEQITPEGQKFDIQLKGSGRTPYSGRGDGRAVLGPMLREYIISEALFALNVPTTRSLAVVETGRFVYRKNEEKGAILARVAKNHLRVGTFEFAANFAEKSDLVALADYAISQSDEKESILARKNPYLAFFESIVKKQAELIAKWQLIGMVHGVMNTDNMSISGESIDFGPIAFIDEYNPAAVFSSIDTFGRYAYKNQPKIGLWNLSKLGEALFPIIHQDENQAAELLSAALATYQKEYNKAYISGLRKKLGLLKELPQDINLMEELLQLMEQYQADFTNTFVYLTYKGFSEDAPADENLLKQAMATSDQFQKWYQKYLKRRSQEDESSAKNAMVKANPVVIPRNTILQTALDEAEQGDYSKFNTLLSYVQNPYDINIPKEFTIPDNKQNFTTY